MWRFLGSRFRAELGLIPLLIKLSYGTPRQRLKAAVKIALLLWGRKRYNSGTRFIFGRRR